VAVVVEVVESEGLEVGVKDSLVKEVEYELSDPPFTQRKKLMTGRTRWKL